MRCWWEMVVEEQDETHPALGKQWRWKGKHRLDADGRFVCGYKSWRTPAERARIRAGAAISRDSLAQEKRDQYERGTTRGTVCVKCGRLIDYVMTNVEFLQYQAYRDSYRSIGGKHPWFVPGERNKASSKAQRKGRQWTAKHIGKDETFECRYLTALRPKLWVPASAGGCARCGRLQQEGRDGNV